MSDMQCFERGFGYLSLSAKFTKSVTPNCCSLASDEPLAWDELQYHNFADSDNIPKTRSKHCISEHFLCNPITHL